METTIDKPIRRAAINIVAIREFLKREYQIEDRQAEGIAAAINEGFAEQDITGFATKSDIKDLRIEISQIANKVILWVAGIVTAQTIAIVGILLRFTGKL